MATVSDTVLGSGPRAPQLRRRHRRDRTMTLLLTLLMIGIGALLVWILAYVALQGLQALDWGFLTDTPPGNPSDTGGGFYNGIIGSLIIVGIATLLAVPLGIGGAVYLNQYATGRMAGVLRLVPRDIREASLALGATKSRTIVSVLLPTAGAGIITGVMLAVARAMGETAPLLLTTLGNDLFVETNPGERMSTLSLQIFGSATGGFPAAQARAWAGALTLIVIVLLLTIIARLIARKSAVGR